jgi:hypothetical protein
MRYTPVNENEDIVTPRLGRRRPIRGTRKSAQE